MATLPVVREWRSRYSVVARMFRGGPCLTAVRCTAANRTGERARQGPRDDVAITMTCRESAVGFSNNNTVVVVVVPGTVITVQRHCCIATTSRLAPVYLGYPRRGASKNGRR